MKKYIVESFNPVVDEASKKSNVVKSFIEVEAEKPAAAISKALSMSRFERRNANWDPQAGSKLRARLAKEEE